MDEKIVTDLGQNFRARYASEMRRCHESLDLAERWGILSMKLKPLA
jgi:hypothetical protein